MELNAYDWEVVRDILVNTTQDKFDNSYPKAASICKWAADNLVEQRKIERLDRYENQRVED